MLKELESGAGGGNGTQGLQRGVRACDLLDQCQYCFHVIESLCPHHPCALPIAIFTFFGVITKVIIVITY